MNRRHFLGATSAVGLASALGSQWFASSAEANDYKALIVVDLAGGNDGHNMLIPTDGAYTDYERARSSVLALPKDSLVKLDGTAAGHTFALHTAMPRVAKLYNQKKLAFISNVGALIEPATAEQVKANAVRLPIGLLSHNDQAAFVQGATEDTSGWAGRALESFNSSMRHKAAAVALSNNRTLVQGRRSAVSIVTNGGSARWGESDLTRDENLITQSVKRMARWQFANDYERIYADSLYNSVSDAVMFAQAYERTARPAADFGTEWFPSQMQFVAQVLPVMPSFGMRRQVFFLSHGGFDTHTSQRGTGEQSQDTLLAILDKSLAALDETLGATGMRDKVTVLVMTEFGRTLRPGSGGGSEHAWGTHWMVMGPDVLGGTVHGRFPPLLAGGQDDIDGEGRFVPTYSADQVGATLMQWMGLPNEKLLSVFPNLANFKERTVPFLRT